MRKLRCALVAFICLGFVLCTRISRAQEYPAMEFYLGYTLINNEYGSDRQNSSGVEMSFGYNLMRQLRLLADLGIETHSTDIYLYNGRRPQANMYQFMAGPEFTFRKKPHFTPFAHVLAGGAWREYSVPSGVWTCSGGFCNEEHFNLAQESGFALGVGGGLDWQPFPKFSVRVAQFDWVHTILSRNSNTLTPAQGELPALASSQDNYRFSGGLVWRFGSKGSKGRYQ